MRLDAVALAPTPRTSWMRCFKKLLPMATMGPILSVRAFEFESLYVLDLLIPDQENDKQNVRVTAC